MAMMSTFQRHAASSMWLVLSFLTAALFASTAVVAQTIPTATLNGKTVSITQVTPSAISYGGGSAVTLYGLNFPAPETIDPKIQNTTATGSASTTATTAPAGEIAVTINNAPCTIHPYTIAPGQIVCGPAPAINDTFVTSSVQFIKPSPSVAAVVRLYNGADLLATSTLQYTTAQAALVFGYQTAVLSSSDLSFSSSVVSPDAQTMSMQLTDEVRCGFLSVYGSHGTAPGTEEQFPLGTDQKTRKCRLRNVNSGFYTPTFSVESATQLGTAPVFRNAVWQVFKLQDDGVKTFSTHVVPEVTAVSPAAIGRRPTLLTITGNGFPNGDLTTTKVQIAGTACDLRSVEARKIICTSQAGQIAHRQTEATTAGLEVTSFFGVPSKSFDNTSRYSSFDFTGDLTAASTSRTVSRMLSDLQMDGTSTPAIHHGKGNLHLPHAGTYQIFCTATDFVQVRIDGNLVCSNEGANVLAPVSRWSGTTVSVINAAGAKQDATIKPISDVLTYAAGATPDIDVRYGLGGLKSRVSIAVSLTPTAQAINGSSFTAPSFVEIRVPYNRAFAVSYRQLQIRLSATPDGGDCSAIDVAGELESVMDRHRVLQSTVNGADHCIFLLEVYSPQEPPEWTTDSWVTMTTTVRGSSSALFFNPVPVRFARRTHTNTGTQRLPVVVFVDNAPAYSSSAVAPSVTQSSASPAIAASTPVLTKTTQGGNISLTGTGFVITEVATITFTKPTASKASYTCLSTVVVSATMVNCMKLPEMPGGIYAIEVANGAAGIAESPKEIYVQVPVILTSVSESRGSWYGGADLSLQGKYFPVDDPSELGVVVGTGSATIFSLTSTVIYIRTAALNRSFPTDPGVYNTVEDVNLTITAGFVTDTSPSELQNDKILRAIPSSVSLPLYRYHVPGPTPFSSIVDVPDVHNVTTNGIGSASTVVTIQGQSLGASFPEFCPTVASSSSIDCFPCNIIDGSSTKVTCATLPMPADTYSVVMHMTNLKGISRPGILYSVAFAVTDVQPKVLSPLGKTTVTVTGVGFSDQVSVTLGKANCVVDKTQFAAGGTFNETYFECVVALGTYTAESVDTVVGVIGGGPTAQCPLASRCRVLFRAEDATDPKILGIFPTSGQQQLITLTGKNFDGTVDVSLGDTPCPILAGATTLVKTTTTMYCQIPTLQPAAKVPVRIFSSMYGLISPEFTFTYPSTVTKISPTEGSVAGGQLVTVTGTAFGTAANTKIMVGGVACVVGATGTSISVTEAICVTGARPLMVTHTGAVTVQVGTEPMVSCCSYTYNATKTVTLSRVSPLGGVGGVAVNLSATNLQYHTNVTPKVTIGGIDVLNTTVLPAENVIMFILPTLSAMWAQFKVNFGSFGLAWSLVQQFTVTVKLNTTVGPTSSTLGGQRITLTGERLWLSEEDNIRVLVCGHECAVTTKTFNKIECDSPPMYNRGAFLTNPELERDAFKQLPLVAFVGDNSQPTSGNSVDGNIATTYTAAPDAKTLYSFVAVDVGAQVTATLARLEFLSVAGSENLFQDATVATSLDSLTWSPIVKLTTVQRGWMVVALNGEYTRYVRIQSKVQNVSLQVAEMRVFGTIASTSLDERCAVVVYTNRKDTQTISSCHDDQCIKTPTVLAYSDAITPKLLFFNPWSVLPGQNQSIDGFTSGFSASTNSTDVTLRFDGEQAQVSTVTTSSMSFFIQHDPSKPTSNTASMSVRGFGNGRVVDPSIFFAERWSARSTWRGTSISTIPLENDNIVIPAGRTILLDVSPPELASLTIYGTLIASPSLPIVKLRVGSIVIDKGGAFHVGSDESPHYYSFTIELTSGHAPTPYGSKVIAVRNGRLDLRGRLPPPSAVLAASATTGATALTIDYLVNWKVGEKVVVTSTSTNQDQAEELTLTKITTNSATKQTALEFTPPLQHYHHGGSETYFGTTQIVAARVLHISRDVRITTDAQGIREQQGAVVLVVPEKEGVAHVGLDGVEFAYCGRLGDPRGHPITVVNGGVMIASEIEGVVVHNSFSRGMHFEGTSRWTLARNIVFKTNGHGIAFVGGDVRSMVVRDNMVVGADVGVGLDEFPACYYFTHPTQDMQRNVAGGCRVAGFWFDLEAKIAGSASCPQTAKVIRFRDNVAHSNGQYGLWMPRHTPASMECADPYADGVTSTTLLRFGAFHNGVHGMFFGAVAQFTLSNCWAVENGRSGISVEEVVAGKFTVSSSFVVARSSQPAAFVPHDTSAGVAGILGPASEGMNIVATKFQGFSRSASFEQYAYESCGPCSGASRTELGGYTAFFSATQFSSDSENRIRLGAPHNDMVVDADSTVFGTAGGLDAADATLLPRYGHLSSLAGCIDATANVTGGGRAMMICRGSYRFHRVVIFELEPTILRGFNMTLTSTIGTEQASFRKSTLHPWESGFVFVIPTGYEKLITGAIVQSTNAYQFTVTSSVGSEWSNLGTALSPAAPLLTPTLDVRFKFNADVARYDILRRKLDVERRAMLPLVEADVIIPTYYIKPGELTITDKTTYSIVDFSTSVITMYLQSNVSEQFTLTRTLCPTVGCVRLEKPVVPPRSYHWNDLRAWKDEQIPRDGADVVIPPGLTVILSSNTSQLRSIVVQGTLVLHSRLSVRIQTRFFVVYGGSITSASKHYPATVINLRSDGPDDTFGVDERYALKPGMMLVLGNINIWGAEYTTQWTRLTSTAAAGTQQLKIQHRVDWNNSDTIVLSTTGRQVSEVEELVVGNISDQGRSITTTTPSVRQHFGEGDEIQQNVRVKLEGKVGVLARRLIVEGGVAGNRSGCSVIFAQYARDPRFAAQGLLRSVEVRHCGFAHTENSNSTSASLQIDGIKRFPLTISRCSVHHSLSHGLKMDLSKQITISDSMFYHTYGSSIVLGRSTGNSITNNLVMSTLFPPHIRSIPQAEQTPYALCGIDGREGVNNIQGNAVAGSESEGMCVQLVQCSDESTQYMVNDNEVNTAVIGFLVESNTAGSSCVSMRATHSWQNSYLGIHMITNATLRVYDTVVHDNHIGLATGSVNDFTTHMNGGIVTGRTDPMKSFDCSYFQCSMSRLDNYCAERAELYGDVPTMTQGEVGFLLGQLTKTHRTAMYSRRHADLAITRPRIRERPATAASVFVNKVTIAQFYYGAEFGICSGAKAVSTDGFTLNSAIPHFFSNITWAKSNDLAKVYIHPTASQWLLPEMCAAQECDALLHVLIHDVDGTFLASKGVTYGAVVSNLANAAQDDCALKKEWNAYQCTHTSYGELQVESKDQDALTRVFAPVEYQDEQSLSRTTTSQQPPGCYGSCAARRVDRPGSVTTTLRTERTYLIDMAAESPRRAVWSLRNCLANPTPHAAIVRILLPSLLETQVWQDGAIVPRSPVALDFVKSAAGASYYETLDQRLYLLLRCDKPVEIHQLVVAVVTMRLNMRIEVFMASYKPTFEATMAGFFDIPTSRVQIYEVYPQGAETVVRLRTMSVDSAEYDAVKETEDVNTRVMRLVVTSPEFLSKQLKFPLVSIDKVSWAQGQPSRLNPDSSSVGLSVGIIITIVAAGLLTIALIAFAAYRLYKQVIMFRDFDHQDITGDRGIDAPQYKGNDFHFREDGNNPRVDLGVKSLRINVDQDEDEDYENWGRDQQYLARDPVDDDHQGGDEDEDNFDAFGGGTGPSRNAGGLGGGGGFGGGSAIAGGNMGAYRFGGDDSFDDE